MSARAEDPAAHRVILWAAGITLLGAVGAAVWLALQLFDSLPIALIVVATLALPVGAAVARPRSHARRSPRGGRQGNGR